LTQHGLIDASNIEVEVSQAEVTLHGQVDSRRTKRMAEDVAASVGGVKDVHNRLRWGERAEQGNQQRQESGMPGGG
jgi:osmotically-inducible protein OsmY